MLKLWNSYVSKYCGEVKEEAFTTHTLVISVQSVMGRIIEAFGYSKWRLQDYEGHKLNNLGSMFKSKCVAFTSLSEDLERLSWLIL